MLEKDSETERLENIKSLLDDIKQYSVDYPDSGLDEYLQMIALYTDRASEDVSDALSLCTVHSAKGLEFEAVFVIGLSEGIFPSEKTMLEGQKGIEEERRLAYVAYTRAKKLLYLTETNSFSYVIQSAKLPSRFINEIDGAYIDHVDEKPKPGRSLIFDEDIVQDRRKDRPDETIYRNGDIVIHKIYGEGIVVGIDSGVLQVAFAHPHGVKKILASHPSIRKKDKNDYS